MKSLIHLIVAILRVVLPWAVKQSRPTAQDADPDRETRNKLRDRIRRHWIIVMPIILIAAGCTRTVYVPHGTPVRLRETVKNVKVWVKDADGEVIAGRMDLYEGWYALSLEEDE